jgi:hypothetical protein
MSRKPAPFTQEDLARAMKVAQKHGMTVEIAPDGVIRLIPVPARSEVQTDEKLWVM